MNIYVKYYLYAPHNRRAWGYRGLVFQPVSEGSKKGKKPCGSRASVWTIWKDVKLRILRDLYYWFSFSRGTGADLPIQSNEAMAFRWMSGLINHLYLLSLLPCDFHFHFHFLMMGRGSAQEPPRRFCFFCTVVAICQGRQYCIQTGLWRSSVLTLTRVSSSTQSCQVYPECFCTQDAFHIKIRNDISEQVCMCKSKCLCVKVSVCKSVCV